MNSRDADPRFLCDAMLGTLARWLRFFGYDTLFPAPGEPDLVLGEQARSEGRWLLTADRELASAGPRSMLVRADDVKDQLTEVFRRLGLHPEPSLAHARCGECNGALCGVSPDEVETMVPPHVLATADRLSRCSGCGRVYWHGSHGRRIRERMEHVVAKLDQRDTDQ